MQEPKISKDLRNLMTENLKHYPQGMICTGFLARTKPHDTVHTTFGGFHNEEDFSNSLHNENVQKRFSNLCRIFSNQDNIHLMNDLILKGAQTIQDENLIESLIDLEMISITENKYEITAKGRIFILATYSIVS